MTKLKNDQSKSRITDRVSTPLLMMTFILALFVAFGGADLLMNMGVSKWVPTGLLMTAVFSVFVQLAREPVQATVPIRETADYDER